MTLDPLARASWRGFLDLLRPPPGYHIGAAFGTTFGLSLDAFIAALYAHMDAEGDTSAPDPLTALITATRLSDRVRVMYHAGNMSGVVKGLPPQLHTLLDRMVVPVSPHAGLFHPKLFIVVFEPDSARDPQRVRLVVGSRNVASSSAFEMGVVLEGVVGEEGNDLGRDAARALRHCLGLARTRCKCVAHLPEMLEATHFDAPPEGDALCRLHLQTKQATALQRLMPAAMDRVLVLSPFLNRAFLEPLLARATIVHIVSTPDAFRRLDDGTFQSLMQRATVQKLPVAMVLSEFGDEEEGYLDGIHAKVVVAERRNESDAVTFVGSGNATGEGWGSATPNVEAMLELRPGLQLDRFLKAFVFEKPRQPRPWIKEFLPAHRAPLTPDEVLRDALTWKARAVAAAPFMMAYDRPTATLNVRLDEVTPSLKTASEGAKVEFIPVGVLDTSADWRLLADLVRGPAAFSPVELSVVSTFVLVRVSEGDVHVERMAVAELEMADDLRKQRDTEARDHLKASISSEEIIAALVLGITHAGGGASRTRTGAGQGSSTASLLEGISVERLLLAVAQRPNVLEEIELLLAGRTDSVFTRFRDDIRAALGASRAARR